MTRSSKSSSLTGSGSDAREQHVEPTEHEIVMLYVSGVDREAALNHWRLGRSFVQQAKAMGV